jgi:hypothetical protein
VGLLDFILAFWRDIDLALSHVLLDILSISLCLSPLLLQQFLQQDHVEFFAPVFSTPSVDPAILIAALDIVDCIFTSASSRAEPLLALILELEVGSDAADDAVLSAQFDATDTFIRNSDTESIARHIDQIIAQIGKQMGLFVRRAGSILPVLSDLCFVGCVQPVADFLSFADLMGLFFEPSCWSVFGDVARLAIQMIHCNSELCLEVPLAVVFELIDSMTVWTDTGESVLLLLQAMAEAGGLPAILDFRSPIDGCSGDIFLQNVSNLWSFPGCDRVRRICWAGFLAEDDLAVRIPLLNARAFERAFFADGLPGELLSAIIEAFEMMLDRSVGAEWPITEATRARLVAFFESIEEDGFEEVAERLGLCFACE